MFNPTLCATSWGVPSATLRACRSLSPSGSSSSRWSGRTSATSMSAWYLRYDPVTMPTPLCHQTLLQKNAYCSVLTFVALSLKLQVSRRPNQLRAVFESLEALACLQTWWVILDYSSLLYIWYTDVVCSLLAIKKKHGEFPSSSEHTVVLELASHVQLIIGSSCIILNNTLLQYTPILFV